MRIDEARVLAARLKKISRVTILGVRSAKTQDDKILILRVGRRELKVTNASNPDVVVGKVARLCGVKAGGWINIMVCPVCLHALGARDGHFHDRLVSFGKSAYAEPVCCRCLLKAGGKCLVDRD